MAGADRAEHRRRIGHPAHRGDAGLERVEVRIVGLDLHDDRLLEADGLEGTVPLQDAGADRLAVALGHAAVDPVDDRAHRLGQRGGRILLLEPPAVDEALLRAAGELVAEVADRGDEVADAGVGRAGAHRRGRQPGQRQMLLHEQAARIGQRGRHRGAGAGRGTGLRAGQRAGGEMLLHRQRQQLRGAAHRGDAGMARIERIALAVAALQLRAHAHQVGQEQRRGIDQHRAALGMRLAEHRRAGQQAGREGRGHRAGLRRAGGGHMRGIAGHQPHLVEHPHELDPLRAAGAAPPAHQAAEHAALADAAGQFRRQEEGHAEVLLGQLQPDLLVLLPDRDQPVDAARLAHHLGKGRQRRHRWRGRRCHARCSGRRRRGCRGRCRCGRAARCHRRLGSGRGRRGGHRRIRAAGRRGAARHQQDRRQRDHGQRGRGRERKAAAHADSARSDRGAAL